MTSIPIFHFEILTMKKPKPCALCQSSVSIYKVGVNNICSACNEVGYLSLSDASGILEISKATACERILNKEYEKFPAPDIVITVKNRIWKKSTIQKFIADQPVIDESYVRPLVEAGKKIHAVAKDLNITKFELIRFCNKHNIRNQSKKSYVIIVSKADEREKKFNNRFDRAFQLLNDRFCHEV